MTKRESDNSPRPSFVERLRANPFILEALIVPFAFFTLDVAFRIFLNIHLPGPGSMTILSNVMSDAGTDMCLLSVSTALACMLEDLDRGDRANVLIGVVAFIVSLILWGLSLWISSFTPLSKIVIAAKTGLVTAIGIFVFVGISYLSVGLEGIRSQLVT
jgi:hypothetical protein